MHPIRLSKIVTAVVLAGLLVGCGPSEISTGDLTAVEKCLVELVVLGVGQDAGAPQIGNPNDPAWKDPSKRLFATSLALIDHENQKRYLFEATPDIREQMQMLDKIAPPNPDGPYLDGIFLTHAHIGHYAGLMFLGRESMGVKGVPVYVMPRMKEFLETNGPWSQLVELGNIELNPLATDWHGFEEDIPDQPIEVRSLIDLGENIGILASRVPHRDEYSETVGFMIEGPDKVAEFIPDIDNWDDGIGFVQTAMENRIQKVQVEEIAYAFIDATFYDDNELPGRDMSQIPHPRVTETMDLIDASEMDGLKEKVHFIHINHTNPLRDENSNAFKTMTSRGYKLSNRGERFCL